MCCASRTKSKSAFRPDLSFNSLLPTEPRRKWRGFFVVSSFALKRYAKPPAVLPDHPATLPGAAVHHFKSVGQFGLAPDLKAGAAGRIIDNPAINNGSLRSDDQFGRSGHFARRPNARKQSWIHDLPRALRVEFEQQCPRCDIAAYERLIFPFQIRRQGRSREKIFVGIKVYLPRGSTFSCS
jgi:hypothetical protein